MRLAAATLLLAGCITHLPVRTREHLTIPWSRDFAEAQRQAEERNKPILMCLIAGEIAGPC